MNISDYINPTAIKDYCVGQNFFSYEELGCHYIEELHAHRFEVWAPNARSVSVVGDFNNWDRNAHMCEKLPGGVWVAIISGLKDGDNYKYFVVGYDGSEHYKTDPYATWCEVRPATASKVWSIDGYTWKDEKYMKKRAETNWRYAPMLIYELHLGSWKCGEDGSVHLNDVGPEIIKYVKKMGFTHIELMPINEYPFDGSWGYQVTGYYAVTSRYGTPQDYMAFIDACHAAGIGVILDWVPAHFPKDEHGLASFDGTKLYEHHDPKQGEMPQWGTLLFNYGRPEVVSFLVSSAMFFAKKYHVDGLRLDAVSAMLYLDFGKQHGEWVANRHGGNINLEAVDFLRTLNHALLTENAGFLSIAEESTAYPMITKPPYVGGLGFSFKWNMGFMNDTLQYMSMDHLFRRDNHNKLTFSMTYAYSENYILAYSHDEVVHGKASMIGKMFGSYDEKFMALRAFYGFIYAHPGKKLLFMGDEFAQFSEWDYQKSLDWFLHEYPSHDSMSLYVRDLNHMYQKYRAMYQVDDSWEGFEWLIVDDNQNSVVAFSRMAKPWRGKKQTVVCVINFTPVQRDHYRVGMNCGGELQLILNSDDFKYSGNGVPVESTVSIEEVEHGGKEYSVELTLPPLSAMFFELKPEEKPAKSKKGVSKAKKGEADAVKTVASKKAVGTKSAEKVKHTPRRIVGKAKNNK